MSREREAERERDRNRRKYTNYGVGFGFLSGALLELILQYFFDIQIYVVGPPFGTFIGLIIGFIIAKNKNKTK
ncbi:hypothetical protein [Alkalibacterium gilvum]|jgi:F0F1-type ATP synthase assembly protein I|uniref:hypothetical protein n=1 Tax=Alkalibacterium gilvum TaxID=1130080 RepID=UPI003F8FDE06